VLVTHDGKIYKINGQEDENMEKLRKIAKAEGVIRD
jgi:hypothetical protein